MSDVPLDCAQRRTGVAAPLSSVLCRLAALVLAALCHASEVVEDLRHVRLATAPIVAAGPAVRPVGTWRAPRGYQQLALLGVRCR